MGTDTEGTGEWERGQQEGHYILLTDSFPQEVLCKHSSRLCAVDCVRLSVHGCAGKIGLGDYGWEEPGIEFALLIRYCRSETLAEFLGEPLLCSGSKYFTCSVWHFHERVSFEIFFS